MTIKDTDDVWRLYRREWVTVYTADRKGDEDGEPVFREAMDWFEENLRGRIKETDMRVDLNTDGLERFWAHVQVFKDNLQGEFKFVEHAQMHAQIKGFDEYVIVPRNSKSDHDIRNYGVVKLPEA